MMQLINYIVHCAVQLLPRVNKLIIYRLGSIGTYVYIELSGIFFIDSFSEIFINILCLVLQAKASIVWKYF